MKRVAIIGAGSWGTALSIILHDNGYDVRMFGKRKDQIDEINNNHTNNKYLPNQVLPEGIKGYTDLRLALDGVEVIISVVPTKVIRGVLKEINQVLDKQVVFVNASKGIEPNSFKRVSEIINEEIDESKRRGIVVLTGPSHAEEVIVRQLTVVAAASDDENIAIEVQEMFNNNEYFRVYTLNDLIGAELGGSLKNIIALAAGIIAGLGYGDNTKAALITRGLVEMRRLAVKAGAKEETLFGLTGIGDLIVTATSTHSRNWNAGYKIGSGKNLEETLNSMTMVVEGVRSCEAAYQWAKNLDVEMPITFAVYDIIFNFEDPRLKISELLNRDSKPE